MASRSNSPSPRPREDRQLWLLQPRGATATEYLVILVLAVLAIAGAIALFGSHQQSQVEQATETIASTSPEGIQTPRTSQRSDDHSNTDTSTGGTEAGSADVTDSDDSHPAMPPGYSDDQDPDQGSAFNPLVLLIFIIGVGVLVYIFFFDDSDGGG